MGAVWTGPGFAYSPTTPGVAVAVASVVWHLSVTFQAVVTVAKVDNDTIAMSLGVTAETYDFVTASVDLDCVVTGVVVRLAPRTMSLP